MADTAKNIQVSAFLKDIMEEEQFLEAVKKGKLSDLQSELKIMVKVYNEQLEQMVRLRVDLELFDYLILAEPQNNQHAQKRSQTAVALTGRRKLVSIVRKQIMERVKGAISDGKKD